MLEMYLDDVRLGSGVCGGQGVLVKEGFEYDDLVPRLYERHEGTEHAFICTSSDGHLRVWIDLFAKERRVGIRYCFL